MENKTEDNVLNEDSRPVPVLLRDDDAWNMHIITSKTGEMSMKTLSGNDPTERISIDVKHRLKIIFPDTRKPELSGYTMLKILKKIGETSNIPTILISVNMRRDMLKSSLNNGATGYLSRPAPQKLFLNKMNEVPDSELLSSIRTPEDDFDNSLNENLNFS